MRVRQKKLCLRPSGSKAWHLGLEPQQFVEGGLVAGAAHCSGSCSSALTTRICSVEVPIIFFSPVDIS
jgi:hypothetical protein